MLGLNCWEIVAAHDLRTVIVKCISVYDNTYLDQLRELFIVLETVEHTL